MRYYQAQDTFSTDLPDGSQRRVVKGEALPESDALVRMDLAHAGIKGRVPLFKPLDGGEPDVKPRTRRG